MCRSRAGSRRFARGWLALGVALAVLVLWWFGVSELYPYGEAHELPAAACDVD